MNSKNENRTDIIFKALSDVSINYNKAIYPHLKKDDHQTIISLYENIKVSVGVSIKLNYPNININDISTKAILDTYLQQEHGIKLTKEELEKILKKPINKEDKELKTPKYIFLFKTSLYAFIAGCIITIIIRLVG